MIYLYTTQEDGQQQTFHHFYDNETKKYKIVRYNKYSQIEYYELINIIHSESRCELSFNEFHHELPDNLIMKNYNEYYWYECFLNMEKHVFESAINRLI
jgi:hypothetical protein